MTRFRILSITAVPLAAVAIGTGSVAIGMAILVAFLAVLGLGVASPQLGLFGPFVCRGNRSRRCVALTFDDGPDASSTPALLDLLRETGTPAAFFCVGQRVAAERELAARIVNEGHLLENHSHAHSNMTNFFTTARLKEDLTRAQAAIHEATGRAPKFFRPPMGLSNPRIFRAAQDLGLSVIGWSARGLDTQCRDPERIVARIVRQTAPGAIILLHDGHIPAAQLAATVRLLLTKLKESGHAVVRLDKLLE